MQTFAYSNLSAVMEWHQMRVDLLAKLARTDGPHSAYVVDRLPLARATKAHLERLAFGGGR